ncbi:peptidoglycan-binding protein [Selenihalanaerobacter shriftii]|uniref:Uncharacterized protein, YkwD family n=1 Tax=Selenihalanaerobacter shriftii TaxID=142842 RepID=A0A1T4N731_9FIRM|nr:peptidoglycan-binding protein [Selenihalanaerobacter shriftii]SJZ74973.1 uncharacterized protein, YkwD family [Selenihalanaerobacter shriftii]
MSRKFTTKLATILVLALLVTSVPLVQAEAATILEYRMHGEKVTTLQQTLKDEGYNPGPVNSYFGYLTKKAVRAFQENNDLRATGEVDQQTWDLLVGDSSKQTPPSDNSNNNNDNSTDQNDNSNQDDNLGNEAGDSTKIIVEYRDRGDKVDKLQARLEKLGYDPGSIKGYFAYMTKRAVKEFQRDNDLSATGDVDEVTWNLLKSKSGQVDTPSNGSDNDSTPEQPPTNDNSNDNNNTDQTDNSNQDSNTGNETGSSTKIIVEYRDRGDKVDELQARLEKLGYDPGSIEGYFAYMTKRAVKEFQRDNDLRATGDVDEATWNLLKSKSGRLDVPSNDTPNNDQDSNVGGTTPEPTPQPTTPEVSQVTAEERQMLNLVNEERAKRGLDPLKFDMRLVKLARKKSRDMIQNNYFGHKSPTYGSPFAMLKSAGINYRTAGENLAGNSSVTKAHKALMNSDGHRRNILKSGYTEVGIGIVDGGPYGKMFTQLFMDEF